MRRQPIDYGIDVAEIRSIGTWLLGRADTNEMHITKRCCGSKRGGKLQTLISDISIQEIAESMLVEWRPAESQGLDFGRVHVNAQHFVTDFSHAGGMYRA